MSLRIATLLTIAVCSGCDSKSSAPRGAAPDSSGSPQVDTLPPVDLVTRHALRVERGSCWLKLARLDPSQIEATRQAFLERNPGWEISTLHVDPFTGVVWQANYFRNAQDIGARRVLSQQEYAQRRLEPLRRNADLIGMGAEDVEGLEWEPGRFWASDKDFSGSAVRARRGIKWSGSKDLPDLHVGWSVTVRLQRDGVVSGFSASRGGPPLEMCTKPSITPEQARASRGIVDPEAQPPSLYSHQSGFVVRPSQIGGAHLDIDAWAEDGVVMSVAKSMTWRLVWTVDVQERMWSFKVDAITGEVVGLVKNFVE